jgi:23S rRNA pseudouridine955/2504/2580 synthase/23S rRNA pseudouridine1911/1915/1917 synthase
MNLRKTLTTIYEDDHCIVVNKPAGLLSIQDRFNHAKVNLFSYLSEQHPKLCIIHRLDRDTSGLILFAKNEAAHKSFSSLWMERQVVKKYHVIVSAPLHPASGLIDAGLEHIPGVNKMRISKKGKPSKTEYQLIEDFKQFALYEACIHTGRTHQIRVHFQHAGIPLAVDPIYGNAEGVYLSKIKRKYRSKKWETERPILSRLSLHAYSLEFIHPAKGNNIMLTAPYPGDFKALINQLRKSKTLMS